MEDSEVYALESEQRIIECGERFHSLRDGNLLIKEYFTKITGDKAILDGLALDLDSSTIVYTKGSKAIRDKSALDFSIVADTAGSYGANHNIPALVELTKFTKSELRWSIMTNQIKDSKKILAAVNLNHTALEGAGITPAIITLLTDDLAKMDAATKLPKNMIDLHKNNKIQFDTLLAEDEKFYLEKFDRGMKIFLLMDGGIPFYLDYVACRKVRHHHMKRKLPPPDPTTGVLELLVYDKVTIAPFPGAILEVKDLSISTPVDADGETYNGGLKPGTYSGRIYCEGYKELTFTFTIIAGKTCSMQFLMEKVV